MQATKYLPQPSQCQLKCDESIQHHDLCSLSEQMKRSLATWCSNIFHDDQAGEFVSQNWIWIWTGIGIFIALLGLTALLLLFGSCTDQPGLLCPWVFFMTLCETLVFAGIIMVFLSDCGEKVPTGDRWLYFLLVSFLILGLITAIQLSVVCVLGKRIRNEMYAPRMDRFLHRIGWRSVKRSLLLQ